MKAAQMGAEEFYKAAAQAGLPTDHATLNKIIDLVNSGHSLDGAVKILKGGETQMPDNYSDGNWKLI